MNIKKNLFIVILLLAVYLPAICVDFSFGVKAGVGIPFFSGDDYDTYLQNQEDLANFQTGDDFDYHTNITVGFTGGIFLRLSLFKYIAIQTDVLFSMIGGAYGWDETDNYYSGKTKESMNCLEFPILLMFKLPVRRFVFNIYGGPNFYLRLGKYKEETTSDGSSYGENYSDSTVKKFMIGISLGAGFDYYFAHRSNFFMLMDLRCTLGLTSLNESIMNMDDWKENVIQLWLGLGYKI